MLAHEPRLARLGAIALLGASLTLAAGSARADETLNFDGADAFTSSRVGGDKINFSTSTLFAHSGSSSVRFVDNGPLPFENWTYDAPFAITSGTLTVWFYDFNGATSVAPQLYKWGGSIILEDAAAPGDFGAVEISNLPYGGAAYYATEGTTDRGLTGPGNKFDSGMAHRSVGWHKAEFLIGASETTIVVDGVASTKTAAPGGSGRSLRLRVMADTANLGGAGNWTLSSASGFATAAPWVVYDDISWSAALPAAAGPHDVTFEVDGNGDPTGNGFDTPGVFGGPTSSTNPFDNPNMDGSVNQWETTSTAHSGTKGFFFANPPQPFRSLSIDLAGATAGTTATVWFYDAVGNDTAMTKFGGSIIIESGVNRANWLAAEIWNFPYPASGDATPGAYNYYLTKGAAGSPNTSSFFSRKLGNRSIGWHQVDIGLYATYSVISVDGHISDSDQTVAGIITGPGLDTAPKIRLLADSASGGGQGANYFDINEVSAQYGEVTTDPYVFYDDITIPSTTNAAVAEWSLFE